MSGLRKGGGLKNWTSMIISPEILLFNPETRGRERGGFAPKCRNETQDALFYENKTVKAGDARDLHKTKNELSLAL